MSENTLQILLLLSYLDIALISVVIAVYAISVSYLGRETSKSISRKKRRITELKETLEKLSKRIKEEKEIDVVQKEINYYKNQQKSLEKNILWLSVKRAVFAPSALFSFSLLACVFGVFEVLPPEISLAFSSGLVLVGAFCLGKTLKAIEKAASEVPKPDFEVFFTDSELTTMQCMANTPTDAALTIHNIGDESAENILLLLDIPKGIKITKAAGKWQEAPLFSEEKLKYDSKWTISEIDLNIDSYLNTASFVFEAKQTGEYKIPVTIKEKRVTIVYELTIQVS